MDTEIKREEAAVPLKYTASVPMGAHLPTALFDRVVNELRVLLREANETFLSRVRERERRGGGLEENLGHRHT